MNNKPRPGKSNETANETIERASAADTDPLTLLDTEDALSAIPDAQP